MKIELDKYDFELIYKSICYFDTYEDGNYYEWFGENDDKVNESFHYLLSLCKEYRDNPTKC